MKSFEEIAQYLEDVYGVQYDRDEKFVICPECCELLYKCDYSPEEFNTETGIACPICECEL